MKKNWIRLLSILLTAVMIFPAAAFADAPAGGSITLFEGTTFQIDYEDDSVVRWTSMNEEVVTVSNTGLLTGVKASDTPVVVRAYNAYGDPVGEPYTVTVKEDHVVGITISGPTKTSYYVGEAFDKTGLVVIANYESGNKLPVTSYSVAPEVSSVNLNKLPAGSIVLVVSYGDFSEKFTITVAEKQIMSITILSDKTEYEVGDTISNLTIRVNYDNGSYDDILSTSSEVKITLNGTTTANRKLVETDTSYYVTYKGFTDFRNITVKPKSGGGSGGGSTDENALTLSVTKQPTKKSYKVGESFDTTGMEIVFKKKDNTIYRTLSAADLAWYISYTFTSSDITTGSNTKTLNVKITFEGKEYTFSIPGITVAAAKKTLDLSVKNHIISNLFVNMKRKSYPVGSTIGLSDIELIGGKDANYDTVMLDASDLDGYSNSFSLEVLTTDKSGNTSRKSSSYRNRIESGDVYTNRSGDKVVFLRFYVDDDYLDFEIESGDSGVYVYYGYSVGSSGSVSGTLLGIYEDLGDALEDVNDVDFEWGTSKTKYSETRKLTLRLGEDASLSRYDGQIALERDIDIDLNGHKLSVYSDVFVFLDKKLDVYKATITNTASETAKMVYENMSYDNLLIDKSENIIFKYEDDKDANLPGIYTLTVEEPRNGAVTSTPALSKSNTVTVSHGNDATFTITPDKNYEIEALKVKAGTAASATTVSVSTNKEYSVNSSTGIATYTMKDIKASATITATFKTVKQEEQKPADTWVNPFKDVSAYASYYEAVKYVSENGLMQGDDKSNFNPLETMTRAQFVTTLGRMYLGSIYSTVAEKDAAMIRTYGTDSQFTDVSYADGRISYAVPYIKWAEANGLVQGYGNGKFGPYDTITHQQMYIIMYRYAQSLANKSINVSNVVLRASDADQLGAGWLAAAKEGAIVAAKYAQQQNFLVNTTKIDPNGNALRYELATLLMLFSANVLGWQ